MAEAAVANQFFCHSCSRHFGQNSRDLVCPHCESGFVEEVENARVEASSDVDVEQPTTGTPTALDMLRGSLMHYWPSSESPMEGYEDPAEGVSFFQINIQPSTSTSGASSTTTIQAGPNEANHAFGGARSRMPERYNLRQRSRPSPTNRTNGSAGASASQPSGGTEEVNFLLEGFLQQLLSGTQPALMFGSTATVQGQPGNAPGNSPWGMFTLHGNAGDYAWGPNGLDNIITQLLGQLDSSGPPPASAEAIEKLPKVEITSDHAEGKKECSVCMEAFVKNDKAKKLPCDHIFHIPCIDNWLKLHNTCPICRKNVERCLPGAASSSGVYYPTNSQ